MLAWIALSLAAEVEGPWAGGAYVDLAPGPDGVHAAWVDGSTLRYARLGQPTETVADVVEAGGGEAWRSGGVDRAETGPQALAAFALVAGEPVVAWLDTRRDPGKHVT